MNGAWSQVQVAMQTKASREVALVGTGSILSGGILSHASHAEERLVREDGQGWDISGNIRTEQRMTLKPPSYHARRDAKSLHREVEYHNLDCHLTNEAIEIFRNLTVPSFHGGN